MIAGEIGTTATGLHRDRRAGRDGSADGVGRPAGWGDAQCVHGTAGRGGGVLGEPELVHVRGTDEPVLAQRLVGVRTGIVLPEVLSRPLVGRRWEMAAVEGLLERAVEGHGAVVTVVGSPGIGKSRLVREVGRAGRRRGVEVFTAFCESHAADVPFHVVARLLRAATGVRGLDAPAARGRVRSRVPDADPEDLLLFDDLLGVADPDVDCPRSIPMPGGGD